MGNEDNGMDSVMGDDRSWSATTRNTRLRRVSGQKASGFQRMRNWMKTMRREP